MPAKHGRQQKFFYGWVIVVASFLIVLVAFAVQYSFGVFFKPLQDEFGWSRTLTSGAFSIYFIMHGLCAIPAGWATDKFGPKITIVIGGLLVGAGLVLTSHIQSLWQLYLFYGILVGVGMSTTWAPVMATASKWFAKSQGLALGIIAAGVGIGTMIMSPVATRFISILGWRTAYFIMGLIAWAIIIPASMFLVKDPKAKGLLAYGAVAATVENNPSIEMAGIPLSQALRTRALWLLFSMYLLCNICIQMVMAHVVRYAIDVGISSLIAATVLSFIGGFSIAGRIAIGSFSDRAGRRKAFIICTIALLIVVLCLTQARNVWMFYVLGAIFGLSYGGFAPLFPALTGELLGLRHLGASFGMVLLGAAVGGTIGPILAGHIFDSTGSYFFAFTIASGCILLAAVLSLFLKASLTNSKK